MIRTHWMTVQAAVRFGGLAALVLVCTPLCGCRWPSEESAAPDGADACLSQCFDGPGSCEEMALDEFDDYETTLHEWSGYPECELPDPVSAQVGGTCEEGVLFVYVSDGLHAVAHYFEPDSRAFVARTSASDILNLGCGGVFYWPHLIDCTDAVVTEVVCGTAYAVGDSITLPHLRE